MSETTFFPDKDTNGFRHSQYSVDITAMDTKMDTKSDYQKDVVKHFVASTTFHGLGRIFTARTRLQRLFWFLLVVTGIVYVSYATVDSIKRYYSYPTTTKVRLIFEQQSVFPAITICNANKYMKRRALIKYPKLASFYMKTGAKRADVNISSEEMERIFDEIGHPLNETLLSCRWASNKCSMANFTRRFVENFGLCFTFNSGQPGHPTLEVPFYGIYFGLSVVLNAHVEDYLSARQPGFFILLHSQNQPVLINDVALSAPTGMTTLVGVLKNKVINLPRPYETACEELKIPGYKKYTKSACISNCFYEYMVKHCGCKKEGFSGQARVCSFYERTTCIVKAQNYFRLHEVKNCVCPEPCEELTYKVSTTHLSFPSTTRGVTRFEKQLRTANMTDAEYKKYAKNSILKVNIFYTSMNYQLVQQMADYSSIDLFGSVGGLVGLFLGGSLLTICEICELFCDLCWTTRTRKKDTEQLVA